MSRHHRAQRWEVHSPKLRKRIEPQLPLPCIECGRAVLPGTRWEVGHRQDAARGGLPTVENTGPVHYRCNRISGGKAGAAVTNSKRRQARGFRAW